MLLRPTVRTSSGMSTIRLFISVPVNNRFDLAAKNALVAAGGTGFTYPACSAPAYSAGSAYTAASQVTYNGSVRCS